jgi:hypothetical protein
MAGLNLQFAVVDWWSTIIFLGSFGMLEAYAAAYGTFHRIVPVSDCEFSDNGIQLVLE